MTSKNELDGCRCKEVNTLTGNDSLDYKKYLKKISVDSINWKLLHQCPVCHTYYEENNEQIGHGTRSVLTKKDKSYVMLNWEK